MSNQGIGTCPRLSFFHLLEFSPTHAALLSECQGLLRHLSKTFVSVISKGWWDDAVVSVTVIYMFSLCPFFYVYV